MQKIEQRYMPTQNAAAPMRHYGIENAAFIENLQRIFL
jgi:hypothetical protein